MIIYVAVSTGFVCYELGKQKVVNIIKKRGKYIEGDEMITGKYHEKEFKE